MHISTHLVVDHLTRMKDDLVCIAGFDLETGDRWRPKPSSTTTWRRRDLETIADAPLRLGTVLDLDLHPLPQRPETEDAVVLGGRLAGESHVSMDDLFEQLVVRSVTDLREIFGEALQGAGRRDRSSALIPPGCGEHSLGTYDPSTCELLITGTQIRVELEDGGLGELSLPVTDLRLYDEGSRPRTDIARAVGSRLSHDWPVLLSVGLSRRFSSSESMEGHWLQVNNIIFPDDIDDHPAFRVG